MPKAAAANHATHDELLIARLYGDDVDSRERALALELVAGCDECAALYADLGAIATATAALPVQRRPRDFALTEDDAARLRPRRGLRARLLGIFGPRRVVRRCPRGPGLLGLCPDKRAIDVRNGADVDRLRPRPNATRPRRRSAPPRPTPTRRGASRSHRRLRQSRRRQRLPPPRPSSPPARRRPPTPPARSTWPHPQRDRWPLAPIPPRPLRARLRARH